MKKIFTILVAFFGLATAFAQTVPNAGFEEWTDETHPVGWNGTFSANIPIQYSQTNFNVIVDYRAAHQSTIAHSGEKAMELVPQTADVLMGTTVVYQPTLPGVVQLGQFNTAALQNIDISNLTSMNFNIADYTYGGIACNQLPDSVTAWVKYVTESDSLRAAVIATRWNNGQRQVVAEGAFLHQGAISEYSQITIPVSVKAGMTGIQPDTVNIIFSAGSQSVDPDSRLYIDDVALFTSPVEPGGDTTAIFEIANLPIFSVMPNPATDQVTVISSFTINRIEVYTVAGTLVETIGLKANTGVIDTSRWPKGAYILRVRTSHGDTAKRLVVQ